jgi:hypothetical protein
MHPDRELLRLRKMLAYSSGVFAVCLLTVVYAAGDGEFVRLAKASFGKPVCIGMYERIPNPFAPKRDNCIYLVVDPADPRWRSIKQAR